jgi:antitoxin MazE
MKTTVQLPEIGNSQGIRLSKQLLQRYQIEDQIEIETTPDAVILRRHSDGKLSWAATYEQMAQEASDFSEWEAVAEDGIEYED